MCGACAFVVAGLPAYAASSPVHFSETIANSYVQKGLVATRFSLFSLVFLTALTDLFFEARALSHPPGVVAAQKSRALWVFGVMPLSSLLALARLLAVIAPWLFMPCSNSSKC